ncbi:MAG: SDR family oxidoreductase [Spirochaetota bacterium]
MNLEKTYPKKRVVITGAGSGLGKAIALQFAQRKWNVIIADINEPRAFDTAQVVENHGGKAFPKQYDVTNEKDCIFLCTYVEKNFDGCDILINNAGVASAGFFEKIPMRTWDWIYTINTKSIILMCRTFIPVFKQQRYGYIVNIASSAGIASLPEMGCYNMTKAAVISLSETLRGELSPYNIHVSVVCPTFFRTNLMDQFISPDTRQKIIAQKFFDHSLSTAEDVATPVIKHISEKRFFIIKQIDGKIIWWFKRHFPELYFKCLSFFYSKYFFYKPLGIELDK